MAPPNAAAKYSLFCFYSFYSCLGALGSWGSSCNYLVLSCILRNSQVEECLNTMWRKTNLCTAKISTFVSWGFPEPDVWNILPSGMLCSKHRSFLSLEQLCMTFPGWTVLKWVVANCLCVVILLSFVWIDLKIQSQAQCLSYDALKCFTGCINSIYSYYTSEERGMAVTEEHSWVWSRGSKS